MRVPLVLWFIASAAVGADRTAAPPPLTPEQHRQKVARLMEESLAAQRASVARQTEATASPGFFSLPPIADVSAHAAADCDPLDGAEAAVLIRDAAKRAAINPELLHSVARRESGLRPCAVSPKGAMGVMQLMPATARELGVSDPFDPAQNIDAGARLLRKYLDQYGSLPLALGAYNAGPARVNETGDVPRIRETLEYVQAVLSLLPKK